MNKRLLSFLLSVFCLVSVCCGQKPAVFSHLYRPAQQSGNIKTFLEDITRQTGIIFEYASNNIDGSRMIRLSGSPNTLGKVLRQVLAGQKIGIIEKNTKIILVPAEIPLPEDYFATNYSIFGFIKEAGSKEPLSDASVIEIGGQSGTRSNPFGYFTLQLPDGKHRVYISYAGYKMQAVEIDLQSNTRIDIELEPKSDIDVVTVTAASADEMRRADNQGLVEDPLNLILGESDPVRSLYLLPGVTNIPDISNGMIVRGGSPDQNVLFMDGNPIFNPTHLLGTLSIVNKTSLKSLQLYKSNFPARYGGALSSVMDVLTKDGNMHKWTMDANAGLLAGSVTVNGPLIKDKTAVMLSFRHSWVNPFLNLVKSGFNVNFYDLNFKCTQVLGTKDKLMLNIYAGHDKINLSQENSNNQQQWGNKAVSLVWNRVLGPRAFINSSLNFSNYDNIGGFRYSMFDSAGVNRNQKVYNTFSSIQQYNLRTEVAFYAGNNLKFNFGGKIASTGIKPFNTNVGTDFINNPDEFQEFPRLSFNELVAFYENEWRFSEKLYIRPGVHFSYFKNHQFHHASVQPRLYAAYALRASHALDISYNHMSQNLHLVTNPYLGINSDAWVPSTESLRPEESDMINVGYTYHDKQNLLARADIYYKKLRHVTNYVDGKNLFFNNSDWEQYLQSGKGWSYGMELKVEKKTARWQMGLNYTLSWNWRRFSGVNNGEKFPFKYDRRHALNLTSTFTYNKRLDFSALWTFATGDVYTLPDRIYSDFDFAQQIIDPLAAPEYRLVYHSSATNQYRTMPYHRMDISSRYHHTLTKRVPAVFTLGVYNVYGSPSQYLYDLEGTVGKSSLIITSRYKFFSVTPYISYSISL